MGHDVFISYATRDKPVADAACAILERRNIRCWLAPRDIIPGADWSAAIIDAIAECRTMILVLSSESNQSEQVKREVATAVNEAKPIVPFRVEDVPLSKHMRYFISTPHWLDAFEPPLEEHLNRLADTVARLLDIRAAAASSQSAAESVAADRRMWDDINKAIFGADAYNPFETTKLSLEVPGAGGASRNICLLAARQVYLGKHRHNDIVLRVFPPCDENDALSNQLSRHHAMLSLGNDVALWSNLNCSNGTLIEGKVLDAEQDQVLHHGEAVCPASVVSMACDIYCEDAMGDETDYERLAARIGLEDRIEPPGNVLAIRLRRTDSLAGLEQYVMFYRAVWVGRGPMCPVLIADKSVSARHAKIVSLGGALWLEPVQEESPTRVAGEQVPMGHLVPLRPGLSVALGEIPITIAPYRQYYLDLQPG